MTAALEVQIGPTVAVHVNVVVLARCRRHGNM